MSIEHIEEIRVQPETSTATSVTAVLTVDQAKHIVDNLKYIIEEAQDHQCVYSTLLRTCGSLKRLEIIVNPHI